MPPENPYTGSAAPLRQPDEPEQLTSACYRIGHGEPAPEELEVLRGGEVLVQRGLLRHVAEPWAEPDAIGVRVTVQ